jgi:DNA-binding beta-propeller fold protein YncE
VRRLDPSGAIGTLTAFSPPLAMPLGLAADAAGNVYVADSGNGCIRRVDTYGRTSVLAGACGAHGAVDGGGAAARFMWPAGLALAGTALYVADTGANAVRRIDVADPNLPVTTLTPAVTQPTGVAVAADGTVYVAETGNARVVALARGALQVVAGGLTGFADGPGPAARVLPVLGLAVLPDGGLAIADTGNYRVRVVRGGAVTTLAGSGRYGARNGPGDAADLVLPTGIAVDSLGRILVADTGTSTVRRITP